MNYQDSFPFSIGGRCINGDWFGAPTEQVWPIMEELLYFVCHAYGIKVHLFVLMSNHFHLIASGPENQLSSAIQFWLAQSSRRITKCVGRINHTWRARHFRRRIGSPHYYLNAYKYFYRNPLEAGLALAVEEYPFSTLRGLLGFGQLIVPVEYDDTLFSDVEGTLRWLNTPTSNENKEAMKAALRRREFKLPRGKDGRQHALEIELY